MHLERALRVATASLQRPIGQGAERGAAADVGNGEPDAFLRADCHDGEIARRGEAAASQRIHRHKPRDHPRRAVEIAAMRHRIEMRADDDARGGAVAPGPSHVEVSRCIPRDVEAELACRLLDGCVRPLLAGAVRVAGHARFVGSVTPESLEQLGGKYAARAHCFDDFHARPFLLERGC